MNCPVCTIDLKHSERNGIEINYCSKCRGEWLDREELDKIIERNVSVQTAPNEERFSKSHNGHGPIVHYNKKKNHKLLLEELFDW